MTRPSSSTAGDLNRAAVLALLGVGGPKGRSEIAARLGLSPATMTQVSKDLLGQGLIEELASAPSRGGRPAQLLGLAGSAKHALGVKVTPDHVFIVDVGLDGVVRRSWRQDFEPSAADALGLLADILRMVLAELDGDLGNAGDGEGASDTLLGVGFAVPGGVDNRAEGLVNAHILGWHDLPLGRRMRTALGLPVLVENDVNALAVAELLYGRGRASRNLLIATIGVGVGAAIVANGSVLRGAHGDAGEFGHIPAPVAWSAEKAASDMPICVCGNRGCLEALIGDRALAEQARRAGVITAEQDITHLRQAAESGDPAADALFARAGEVLGRAVAGIVNVIDPEKVVLFGEGTSVWKHWEEGFETGLRSCLYPPLREVPVEVDSWDDESWALGAAALVLATPFDTTGFSGDQAPLIRARLVRSD